MKSIDSDVQDRRLKASAVTILGRSARSQAEGMNLTGQFVGKQGRNHPVTVETRAPFKRRRNDFNTKMGFSFRTGSNVTPMTGGFIDNF